MKIICIGRNYTEHIKEMQAEQEKDPVFFMKADSSLQRNNRLFFIPDFTQDCHYELELVLRICKVGKAIEERFAHRYYDVVTVGIDFTARDLQAECKKKGLPWDVAKSFDQSARIGEWLQISDFENPLSDIPFWLKKNDEIVQQSVSGKMIHNFDKLIAYLSERMTLKIGDLIFTGTPSGVGAVKSGDRLMGGIADKTLFDFEVK